MSRAEATSVLVLPGGGYEVHADYEAEPVAAWMRSIGLHGRVVRYPVRTRHPGPLNHVRGEIERERSNGARRVGVLGFSAGGHLAGLAALAPSPDPAARADFAVLCYPVVSMLTPTHEGSRHNLLGEDATEAERAAVSLERLVTSAAPPFFIWHTVGDPSVPIGQHPYRLAVALAEAGVPHELHAFPGDVHGIGLAENTAAHPWLELCRAWLSRIAQPANTRSRE